MRVAEVQPHAPAREPGPSIRAIPFEAGSRDVVRLLTKKQQAQLASIATRMHVPPRTIVYREDTPADRMFVISRGVMKAYRDLPSGRRRVMAFLFPDDLFGIAETGRYVNTLQAVTAVTLYRFDRETLVATLRRDAELQFQFLCKATHELRQSFRRSMVVGRRDAVGRLAMFLYMLERESKGPQGGIDIPMSRSDAANYLGLSLEAVSRAAGALQRKGIVQFAGRHKAHVINRPEFDQLVTSL